MEKIFKTDFDEVLFRELKEKLPPGHFARYDDWDVLGHFDIIDKSRIFIPIVAIISTTNDGRFRIKYPWYIGCKTRKIIDNIVYRCPQPASTTIPKN